MGLTKLGVYLELVDSSNSEKLLGAESVIGISVQKTFISTKADLDGVNLKSYKVVPPCCFAYVPDTSRRGDKVALAFNTSKDCYLVSSISVVFRVKESSDLLADFLYMYFNRPEFDRYARYHSWGSAREPFSWQDMCDIELDLPSREIQQKYVDIYLAMKQNQQCYERGLEDLKLTCDGYIEELQEQLPKEQIGVYISRCNKRNEENYCTNIMGLSTEKKFRTPQKKTKDENYEKFKIVSPEEIAYVQVTDTWKVLAFALNDTSEEIAISPIYEVFSVDKTKILPHFLAIWMKRKEFDRYARFHSWGSARETFSWDEMCAVKIPIPELHIQQDIVNIYKAYEIRREISEKLKEQMKNICPILVKGAVEEGAKR